MSWLIDELADENNRLNEQLFDVTIQRNRLIEEYSEEITRCHGKNDEIERLKRIIDIYELKMNLKRGNELELSIEIKRLYPKLIDKIKLFWRIACG